MQRTIIQNGTIATSREVFKGDLLLQGETIRQVGGSIPSGPGDRVIDAAGRFVLPGGVDPHTHFDLDTGRARASDDFYTGSVAAACGGTTTIIDHMAFGPAGCRLTHQPAAYHKLARRAVIDYGFHGVVQHVDEGVLADMAALKAGGITSLKIYLTYGYLLHNADVLAVLRRAGELGLTVCVHCENHAILTTLNERLHTEGRTSPRYHAVSRPPEAEAEAVFRMLMLAKTAGQPRLYIVHLSSALGLAAFRLAQAGGQPNIFAETCPQYLLLDESRYDDPVDGLKYILSPPLRDAANQEPLWAALEDGGISTIGTDHCPFFFDPQKLAGRDDFSLVPNGIPGVELRMAQMFSEGYRKGRLTLPQMVRACCTAPAEIFGIAPQKGDIREGADADLVVFDPEARWTVTHSALHERVDYTPYEGMELEGRPTLTLSRGEIVAENGRFTGTEGRGRYLHRMIAD